jgi:hypothetical protein
MSEILRARVAPLPFVALAGQGRDWQPDSVKAAVNTALGMLSSVLNEPQFKVKTLFRLLVTLPPEAREFVLSRLVLSWAGEHRLPMLEDLLGQDETVDIELLETVSRLSSQGAAEAIYVVAEKDRRKTVRKKAKALLYGLAIKGVVVETKPKPVFSPALAEEPSEEIARLSLIDREFDRLLILAQPAPRTRFEVVQAILSYRSGIRRFFAGVEAKGDFKKSFARFLQDPETSRMTDIPPSFGLYLIAAACHAFPAAVTAECREWLNRKGIETSEPPEHPLYRVISPESLPLDPSPLRAIETLPFEGLDIPPQELPSTLARWKELAESPIILPEHQKKAMENEILHEAVREYFTEERRRSFKRFLEDEAYLKRESAPTEARELLTAGIALERDPATLPPVLEFLRRQLDRLTGKPEGGRRGREEGRAGGGRIVLPGTRRPGF